MQADAQRRLGRAPAAQQQGVEAAVERDQRAGRRERERGPPRHERARRRDRGQRAEAVAPAEVERARAALVEQQRDPGHAARREVGAQHLHEAPALEMRALDLGPQLDARAGGGHPHPELDVLDRGDRVALGVEAAGGQERLAAHRAESRPRRSLPGRGRRGARRGGAGCGRPRRRRTRWARRRRTRTPRRARDRARRRRGCARRRRGGPRRRRRRTPARRPPRAAPRRCATPPARRAAAPRTTITSSGGPSAASTAPRQRASVAGRFVAGMIALRVGTAGDCKDGRPRPPMTATPGTATRLRSPNDPKRTPSPRSSRAGAERGTQLESARRAFSRG